MADGPPCYYTGPCSVNKACELAIGHADVACADILGNESNGLVLREKCAKVAMDLNENVESLKK